MKENRIYLIHICDCLIKIKSYTKEGKLAFLEKSIIQDAVMRNLRSYEPVNQKIT
jgi:uncharacterized protein with HEPN domain